MDPAQRVGVKDVARLAGVSQGTVSNVLNHPERVSSARREAVEEAIRELGFVRHEAARHLRAGYSSTIGLLLLDAWNPGFTDVARGVEDATAKQGMTVLISNSARDLEREKTYLRLFAEQRVAGVIVIPHDEYNERVHQIRAGGMPVVVVDRAETGADAHSLCVDDVAGGELAARYLMSLGHRHLAFIGDEALAIPVHDRLAGVRKAVAEVEFETGEKIRLDVLPAALSVEGGREVGEALARLPVTERPTAITAAIDLLALGVLQALHQHNLEVPGDLSLVGYDDIPVARQLAVPLTTVRRPHYEMGIEAARMLSAVLEGKPPRRRHLVFEPVLVVRDSTGPAPERTRRSKSR